MTERSKGTLSQENLSFVPEKFEKVENNAAKFERVENNAANSPDEVLLQQCARQGKKAGDRNQDPIRKQQPSCYHRKKWQDKSQNWNTTIRGYVLLRTDRQEGLGSCPLLRDKQTAKSYL